MNRLTVRRVTGVLIVVLLFCSGRSLAQPVLPDMNAATSKGVNYLSWTNQFDGIKSIAVQRSSDSVFNWGTIGYVKALKKGPQGFIDGHPLPGKNWYRLYIIFASDLTWYGNYRKLMVDSAALASQRVMPPNDSLQKYVGALLSTGALNIPAADSAGNAAAGVSLTIPESPATNAYSYVRSQYVFTNPYTSHVNVELPDVTAHRYQLTFYDGQGHTVLNVSRVKEPVVIIDKRNFQKKGLYKFDLMKDEQMMETGYITIY